MGIFRGGGARAPSGDGLREGSGYLGASGANDWRRRAELAGTNKLREGMGATGERGTRGHQQASRRHGNYRGRGALADGETLRAGILEVLGEGYKFSWRAEDGLFSFSMS